MQTLITDTCALIYLYHADLLRCIERMYQLITIPEVLQELSVKATKNEQKVYYQILEIVTVKNTKQRSFSKKLLKQIKNFYNYIMKMNMFIILKMVVPGIVIKSMFIIVAYL